MRDRAIRHKCIEKSKINTIKVGVRSISDIIANKKMYFSKKVNYIRHHYTYYEGNYDLFATAKGTPNSRKFKLNRLIIDIINGVKDASELKEFNKQILEWRKQADEEKKEVTNKMLSNFDGSSFDDLMQWEIDIKNAKSTAKEYIQLIKDYINAHNEEKINFRTLSYKDIKKKALEWLKVYTYPELNKHDIQDMTPGEYFRHNYLLNHDITKPSKYLDLICMYLDSKENKKYKKELLETKKIDAIKEEAIQWAILKVIDNDQNVLEALEKCPHKVRVKIKERAGLFTEKDEDKRAYQLMKKWTEDMGYNTKKEVVNE